MTFVFDINETHPDGRPVWEIVGHTPDGWPVVSPVDYQADECAGCDNDEHDPSTHEPEDE